MLTGASCRSQALIAAVLVAGTYSGVRAQADPAIAYVADYSKKGKSYWDVTVMNSDGTNRKVIWSRNQMVWNLAWSPDLDGNPANGYGGTLAIQASKPSPPGGIDLWLLDVVVTGGVAEGVNPRVLFDSGVAPFYLSHWDPAWSPDLDPVTPGYQGRIVFIGNQGNQQHHLNLVSMVWDGVTAQPEFGPNSSTLLYAAPCCALGSPTWSPEGSRIAVKRGDLSGVLVLDGATGGVLASITGLTSPSMDCDWSRTPGSSLIALRNADNLHTLDVDVGISSLQAVPAAPCRDWNPTWSPDDQYIVFQGIDCGNNKPWTIRRTDPLTGVVTTLAAESGKNLRAPDWRRF